MDKTQNNMIVQHYEAKLRNLYLDINVTATDFINNFELYVQKLGKLEGVDWLGNKKVCEFKDKVTDKDNGMECCIHSGDFKTLIQSI
eukprot:7540171-Ditylum_brightwellii.AAC.1